MTHHIEHDLQLTADGFNFDDGWPMFITPMAVSFCVSVKVCERMAVTPRNEPNLPSKSFASSEGRPLPQTGKLLGASLLLSLSSSSFLCADLRGAGVLDESSPPSIPASSLAGARDAEATCVGRERPLLVWEPIELSVRCPCSDRFEHCHFGASTRRAGSYCCCIRRLHRRPRPCRLDFPSLQVGWWLA